MRRVIDGRLPHSLVLRVALVQPVDTVDEPEPPEEETATPQKRAAGSTLLLTDGWHGISAALDADLQELVTKGSIRSGTTLLVCAASLEALVPPRLSLHFNGTFRFAPLCSCTCHAAKQLLLDVTGWLPAAGKHET